MRLTLGTLPVRPVAHQESHCMDVRPLHDRVIVRRLDEGEQRSGGIIIPDSAKEKPQRGTVIAAGSGKVQDDGRRVALDVKAGDQILFGKYTSQEIKLQGQEYLDHAGGRSPGHHRRRRGDPFEVTGRREWCPSRLNLETGNGKTGCVRRFLEAGDSSRGQ